MSLLLKMIWTFFQIGLFTIGGGYAMIPLITDYVTKNNWMTTAEVADVIAIAKMTPGPFAVNTATFAGMKIFSEAYNPAIGFLGALACTIGVILPSIIIVLIVSKFFFQFQNHKLVQGALTGIRPVVVSLIAVAVYSVASITMFDESAMMEVFNLSALWKYIMTIDPRAILVLVIMLIGLFKFKKHPVMMISICAAMGIIFWQVLPMVWPWLNTL